MSPSQWPRGLRRSSSAARLLRSWVRIPPAAWIFVCCECYVLSGRGLCDELITRPEESYRLWCVVVCDQETSRMKRPWLALGRSATKKNTYYERVFLPLVIQHVMLLRRIVFRGLSGSAIFFHLISHMARFSKMVIENEMCLLIFSTTFVWNISHYKKNWAIYDHKCILVFM